jgi:RNA polymerase sigma-70 factor (ECF subfamily)
MRKRQREVNWDASDSEHPIVESEIAIDLQPIDVALMRLPESQRTALVLTYYQNLSNRDVAEIMNSSVRAVESLLVRARGNLKKQLETQL